MGPNNPIPYKFGESFDSSYYYFNDKTFASVQSNTYSIHTFVVVLALAQKHSQQKPKQRKTTKTETKLLMYL